VAEDPDGSAGEAAAREARGTRGSEKALLDSSFTPEVIRRNMICCILVDAIWSMGYTEFMIAANPLYKYLGLSESLIGLITGFSFVGYIGVLLSPLITCRFRVKKYYLFVTHIPYLGSLGLIGIGLLLSDRLDLSTQFLVQMLIVLSAASWLFGGFVTLPHWEFSASTIPMSHRGRFYGYSNVAGCALGLVSNALGIWILAHVGKPHSYGYLLVMTWLICQGGYIAALFAREKPAPIEKAPKPWSRQMIRAVHDDKPYLRVLGLYLLFYVAFSSLVTTFVPYYGLKVLNMPDQASGKIGMIQKIVSFGVMLFVGHLIDRVGAKRVLNYSSGIMVAALLPLLLFRSPWSVYWCAGFGIIFINLLWSGFMPIFYGLPKPENRAGHFTAQIVTWYAAMALGPMVTGVLCRHAGYLATFTGAFLLAIAGIPLAVYLLAPLGVKASDYDG
jgi:MFS family permease